MSKFVCECGKECKSQWHLDKHKTGCKYDSGGFVADHPEFTNRFANTDVCPVCGYLGRPFYKEVLKPIDATGTLACLDCGLIFKPKKDREKLREECAKIKWKRPQT